MASDPSPPLGSVLVTGGCGCLGSHIVSLLLERYPQSTTSTTRISVLDISTVRNRYDGVDYYDGDLSDTATVRRIFEKVRPTTVMHTASPTAFASRDILLKVNVGGTKVLLEEAQRIGTVEAFVYTSSSSVISDTVTDLINADERFSVITGQGEFYSDTKAQAESLVLAANRPSSSPRFCTAALRPSGIFGERDNQVLNSILWAARANRTGVQLGANTNLFDFTYAGNVAHAHILAAAALLAASAGPYDASTRADQQAAHAAAIAATPMGKSRHVLPTWPDGQAYIITNGQPVCFWDFSRAAWFAYYAAACEFSSTGVAPFAEPVARPVVLPRGIALVIATIMHWVFWGLRLGEPKLTPPKVTYACMTRYFRTVKAEKLLGYKPVWSLEEGVVRGARWFAQVEAEEAEQAMGKKGR